jgi:hypothetical protein
LWNWNQQFEPFLIWLVHESKDFFRPSICFRSSISSGSLSVAGGSEEGPGLRYPALHVLTGDWSPASQTLCHFTETQMTKSIASPGNFFPDRKRRVAKLSAELLGRSLLPFPHFATVDHQIMRVALSLDLYLAKFDQSCFHISMFRSLKFQGKE